MFARDGIRSGASTPSKSPQRSPRRSARYKEPVGENGKVIVGDPKNLQVNDYIGFERIGAEREWNFMVGRVVSFPSSLTVKILQYDPCNLTSVAQDPRSEEQLKKVATEKDLMQVYKARESLKSQLKRAVIEENEATKRLFADRDETLQKLEQAKAQCKQFYGDLDQVRMDMSHYMHLWCCLRAMQSPYPDMYPIVQAVMLVLKEDAASHSWEKMQAVMYRNDFFQRIMDTDCAVIPMSEERCARISAYLNEKPDRISRERAKRVEEEERLFKLLPKSLQEAQKEEEKRNAKFSRYRRKKVSEGEQEMVGIFHALDVVLREWLRIQIKLSESGEARVSMMNECFARQQKHRVRLFEINEMRTNISRLEEEMLLKKKLILSSKKKGEEFENLKLDSTDYDVCKTFHRRQYGENDGRYVNEVILRQSVLVNFGQLKDFEDRDGYVTLGQQQFDFLRNSVFNAAIEHDANTMEDLLNATETNEKELAELRARIDNLQSKETIGPEEAEELTQLLELHAERDRRYHATLAHIAHFYACCRGARDVTIAEPKGDTKYLRLPLKFSGDWSATLADPKEKELLQQAFQTDLEQIVTGSIIQDITFRNGKTDMSGGHWRLLFLKQQAAGRLLDKPADEIPPVEDKHLLTHFSVTYTGPFSEAELTYLYQHGVFPNVEEFYASRHNGQKTFPLNTYAQEQTCATKLGDWYLRDLPPNFNISGAGAPTQHKWYLGPDGTDCMRFNEEIERQPDWRRSHVVVPTTRVDFEATVFPRDEKLLSSGDL